MKTILVNVPDKDSTLISALLKKLGLTSRFISEREREEYAMSKWIEEGMKSDEVDESVIRATLKKNGVKI